MKAMALGLGVGWVVGILSVAGAASAAEGDACSTDADCGEGYLCDLAPSSSSGSSGSATSDGAGDVAAADTGECVQAPVSCTSDADCGEHYACEVLEDSSSAAVTCDAAGNCTTTESSDTAESTEGECVGVPIECTADTECPTAATCIEGVCAFDLVSCTADADCGDENICAFAQQQECSSVPCAAGEECSSEPVCETVASTEGFCLPKVVACTTDSDCSAGDLCYDIPNDDAPTQYANADLLCLPEGLVGAFEGYVSVAFDGVLTEASSDEGSSGGVSLSDGSTNPEAAADDVDSEATQNSGDDAGCSLSTASAPEGPSAFAAFSLALALFARRRRRCESL